MSEQNITREQLVALIKQLAASAENWNDVQEDGDRGRGDNPLVIVIYEDGSGAIASSLYDSLRDVMNVQHSFDEPESGADYLIRMHDALNGEENHPSLPLSVCKIIAGLDLCEGYRLPQYEYRQLWEALSKARKVYPAE